MRKRSFCQGISNEVGTRKTVWRFIRTISVAISAMLMVLFLVVMVWSYFRNISVYVDWDASVGGQGECRTFQVCFDNGKSVLSARLGPIRNPRTSTVDVGLYLSPLVKFTGEGFLGYLGFGGDYLAMSQPRNIQGTVFCPTILPLALSSIWPAMTLRRWRIIRHRRLAGLCPVCGYDLRASTDRCPECGREIDPARKLQVDAHGI